MKTDLFMKIDESTAEKSDHVKNSSALMSQLEYSISKKIDLFKTSLPRYAVRSMLAGLFLGLGTAVGFYIAIRMQDTLPGLDKAAYAFMFSWGLVMIIFLNAELGTSNMLYTTIGVYKKRMAFSFALKLLFTCILFNFIGGVLSGYLFSLTTPFGHLAPDNYMFAGVTAKLTKTTGQILVEGMFANILVNIAVLISLRMKDDTAKVLAIVFVIFIFSFLGYEHVIANFPAFSLTYFASHGALSAMTAGNVIHNLFFTLIGNFIGGGLVMGLGYAWLNNTDSKYVD